MSAVYWCIALVTALFVSVPTDASSKIEVPINPTLPPTVKSSRRVTPPPIGQNSSICYKYVGCFDTYPPFDNTGGVLPNPPEKVGTVFLLYSPESSKIGQQLDYKDKGVSISKTDFNPLYPTKFVIHGFTQDEREKWLHQMKDTLLTTGPMNVIIVGWGPGASAPDYPKAVANTRLVAKQVVLLINLLQAKGTTLDSIHLIGHSLGAHISGYVGAAFNGQIARISGMDPAGPFYESYDAKVRLNPTNAKFVDVVHSNGKPLVQAGAGLFAPSGHVDFYPNGGKTQPGCPSVAGGLLKDILGLDLSGAANTISCSHSRSHELYIESIGNENHCGLVGRPCGSVEDYESGKCSSCGERGCSELGYHSIEYAARGTFYLLTKGFKTASAPKGEEFCGLTYNIRLTSTEGPTDIKGSIKLDIKGTESTVQTSFQGDGDTLDRDAKIVIVDYKPLGELKEVSLTYKKHEGFFFGIGSGTDEWFLDFIEISQESKMFKFCNKKRTPIKTEVKVTISRCDE